MVISFVEKEYPAKLYSLSMSWCQVTFCDMREIILKVPAKRASRFHTHPAADAEPHGIGQSPHHGAVTRHGKVTSLTSFYAGNHDSTIRLARCPTCHRRTECGVRM